MSECTAENIFETLDVEHRDGLLLCWKIREGIRKDIDITRIKAYTDWYWVNCLEKVFKLEEEYLFSLLPKDDKIRKKVISQHKKIKRLFEEKVPSNIFKSIMLIEEELEHHIRFAEKELQQRVLEIITPEELQRIEDNMEVIEIPKWEDTFWE